jgi:hypothetical protein
MKRLAGAKTTIAAALAAAALAGAAPAGAASPQDEETGRGTAIHDCSVKASKWSFSSWETTQLAEYRSCMAEHGQEE